MAKRFPIFTIEDGNSVEVASHADVDAHDLAIITEFSIRNTGAGAVGVEIAPVGYPSGQGDYMPEMTIGYESRDFTYQRAVNIKLTAIGGQAIVDIRGK